MLNIAKREIGSFCTFFWENFELVIHYMYSVLIEDEWNRLS